MKDPENKSFFSEWKNEAADIWSETIRHWGWLGVILMFLRLVLEVFDVRFFR